MQAQDDGLDAKAVAEMPWAIGIGDCRNRRAIWLLAVLGGAGVATLQAPVRINLSPSMPIGIYYIVPVSRGSTHTEIKRGDLVTFCLPPPLAQLGSARGYLPRHGRCPDGGSPIGKPVAAVAADVVTVDDTGLSVNGVRVPHSTSLAHDAAGRLLPRVGDGQYLVRQRPALGYIELLCSVMGLTLLGAHTRYVGNWDVAPANNAVASQAFAAGR